MSFAIWLNVFRGQCVYECPLFVWMHPVWSLLYLWLPTWLSDPGSWVMLLSIMHVYFYFIVKKFDMISDVSILTVLCTFSHSCCSHCVAVSPDSGAGGSFPTGGNIPHVPGPDTGKLPQGEGCFECDIKNQDIPLSKRAKRAVHNLVSVMMMA